MFDLNSDLTALQQDDTSDFDVLNPSTQEKTGWRITFAGPGHPKAIEQKNAILRRALKMARSKREQTEVDTERQNIDFIVDRIVTWSGATQDFSPELARSILADPKYSWLRSQINSWLSDDASFIKTSANA